MSSSIDEECLATASISNSTNNNIIIENVNIERKNDKINIVIGSTYLEERKAQKACNYLKEDENGFVDYDDADDTFWSNYAKPSECLMFCKRYCQTNMNNQSLKAIVDINNNHLNLHHHHHHSEEEIDYDENDDVDGKNKFDKKQTDCKSDPNCSYSSNTYTDFYSMIDHCYSSILSNLNKSSGLFLDWWSSWPSATVSNFFPQNSTKRIDQSERENHRDHSHHKNLRNDQPNYDSNLVNRFKWQSDSIRSRSSSQSSLSSDDVQSEQAQSKQKRSKYIQKNGSKFNEIFPYPSYLIELICAEPHHHHHHHLIAKQKSRISSTYSLSTFLIDRFNVRSLLPKMIWMILMKLFLTTTMIFLILMPNSSHSLRVPYRYPHYPLFHKEILQGSSGKPNSFVFLLVFFSFLHIVFLIVFNRIDSLNLD